MLETGSLYSTEDLARSEQRRRMAQLSTNLGAVQGGIQSIPTALIPGSADRTMAAPSTGANSAHPQTLPPAAVGPLSLRIAAANGDPSAEFEVAARLAEGRGVEQDFKQAVIWYQRSASRGFAPAQYRLGTLYERGLGVKAELGRAKAWYRSAAEKGNIKAMHNLAVLSAGSVPSDYKTAAHWFTEAADRGVRDSQFNLAVLLESGIGVQQDLKAAYGWFKIAAQSGDKEAPRRIEQLRHRLVAAEISTGEAFARNWRAKPADPLVNDVRAAGEAWKLRDNNGVAG
jgi:localization factor PodJL